MREFFAVNEGEFVLEEKRSRFIAYARKIKDEGEAERILAELRKKHYDARHVCYAYIADEDGKVTRFSDDGEPSGTAGLPILETIKGNNVKKSIIAVVRYFGGILLGTGGLTHAYKDSASGVMAKCGCVLMREYAKYALTADYTLFSKMQTVLRSMGEIISVDYAENVNVVVASQDCNFTEKVFDISAGKIKAKFIENEFFPVK